jgi:hypothetical protein
LAEEYIGDRYVDIVDIETATESLKRAIDRYGIELFHGVKKNFWDVRPLERIKTNSRFNYSPNQ